MSPAEVWTLLQFLVTVALGAWSLHLHERAERTEVRLAEARIDLFNLVDLLDEHDVAESAGARQAPLAQRLRESFPHLYDVDERAADERAVERAS